MDKELTPREIIDALGGTSATAKLCRVSRAAASQWKKHGIPQARLMFLRLAKPEIFGLPARSTGRRKTDKVS